MRWSRGCKDGNKFFSAKKNAEVAQTFRADFHFSERNTGYLCRMAKLQFESDRIVVADSRDSLEITISGKIPKSQFTLLSAWLLAWTLAGLFVLSQLFSMQGEQQVYMLVWLAFWAYFEYRVASVWLWRKYGREVLKIQGEQTELRFEVAYGGRAYALQTSEIRNLRNLEKEKGGFVKSFYSSFWTLGGEAIGFYAKGKLYTMGRQISVSDADTLIRLMQKHLPS